MSTPFRARRNRKPRTTIDHPRRPSVESLEARLVLDSTVVFNELMYHPANDQPQVEWLELHNQMAVDMDISAWRLDGGVEFQFDDGTIIAGGGYLVVANDPVAMRGIAPAADVHGPFLGRLANDGEDIRLINNSDRLMDSLPYDDRGDWPVGPDGSGMTLAKREKLAASAPAGNWTSSPQRGGSPGIRNFADGQVERISADVITATSSSSTHVPESNALAGSWTDPEFVEGGQGETWRSGATSVGFTTEQTTDYAAEVASDNPLAYWRFAENSVAQPAANQGLAGAEADGAFFATAGVGQPSLLDQPDDHSLSLSMTAADAAMSTSGFEKYAARNGVGGTGRTMEFWTQVNELPNSLASLSGDGEGALDFGFMVYVTAAGNLRSFLRTTSADNFGITAIESQQKLEIGEAHHIVASWDQPSGAMAIYIDGLAATTTVSDGSLPNTGDPRNTTNPMFVGRDQRNTGGLDADIDELAVYNYALPPDRIASHFDAGKQVLANLIATDLADSMHTASSSAYLRIPFQLDQGIDVDQLAMTVRYDDGFVAYLNGTEVARRNAPDGSPTFASVATVDRSTGETLVPETIDLAAAIALLNADSNLLAIHGLNSSADDATFLLQTSLSLSGFPKTEGEAPPLVLNEIAAALDATFHVELLNEGNATIDLEGVTLVRSGATTEQFVFPPGASLAPRGYVSLSELQLAFGADENDRMFLFTPGQQVLLDAQHVMSRLQGRSAAMNSRWQFPTGPSFGSVNEFHVSDQIVINEIMYHARPISFASPFASPGGQESFVESSEEWIELYNRGSTTVDLSGWALSSAVEFAFPAGTMLPADSYLVVAADAAELAAKHPQVTANIVGDYAGRLNDHDDLLQLLDVRGNLADEVHYYDGGRWPQFADGGGSSLELRDPDADNALPGAWTHSAEHTRSEWQTYTYRGPAERLRGAPSNFHEFSFGLLSAGEVLIDDVSVVEDPDGAALQFIQNGSFTGGFDRWRPVGNQTGRVVADPADPGNEVFHLIATGPEEHLQNHVETTLKYADTFERVDRNQEYEISFRAKWLAGSPQLNTRLFFNYLPRTSLLAMPAAHGTPGTRNSTFEENLGPTYAGFGHAPLSPASGEDVVVSVTPSDPDRIASVTLWYSVDEGSFQSLVMTSTQDGTYLGSIPGQREGQTVQFYVRAADLLGAESTYPAAGPASRAAYRVGTRPTSTTGLHNMQIIMLDSDETLIGERTNLMSNHRLGATILYQDEVFYDVGVRLKGSEHGRPDNNRRGFSVRFHPDQLFRGVHETVSIDRSGGWRFGRTFGQDEILIHHFFNRAGDVPSMYNDLIYVDAPTVPDGTAILQMSRFNDVYLDSQFANGSNGTAYEYELIYSMVASAGPESLKAAQEGPAVAGIRVGTDLGNDKEAYRHYFLIKNNRMKDDYAPMMTLAKTFRLSTDAFNAAIPDVIDVDQWLRAFAAMSLSGANDNYNAGSQHNAIFYQRPSDGKMLLLPFDMDFAFHLSSSARLSQNGDLSKMLREPNNEHAFLGHLHDIMSTSFNRAYMEPWVAHYDDLLPRQNISGIMSWIDQRESFVQRQLPDQVAFSITTPDLNVDTPTATIRGHGWINVRQLRLSGTTGALPLNWLNPTEWEATVNLTTNQQNLMIEAVDLRGNVLGTDSINITSTAVNPIADSLRITEISFNPYEPTTGELAVDPDLDNDDFEFIEVTNVGSVPVNLLNVRFTAGVDFMFGDQGLAPGESTVVVNDVDAFALRYGGEINVAGRVAGGRLSNAGERLVLTDPWGETIVELVYNDGGLWPERADGVGATLVAVDPALTPAAEYAKPSRWRGSVEFGGSPGAPAAPTLGVVINELLANTDAVDLSDAIELLNTSDEDIDISGWYLSDSSQNLQKFSVPAGTILAPGARVVFDETDFNPTPASPGPLHFALSGSRGDDVWLTQSSDAAARFIDDVHFGASRANEALGLSPDGAGSLTALTRVTLGAINSAPRFGPVVVTEIHNHPTEPTDAALQIADDITTAELAFVEVHNSFTDEVDLTDWRLRGSVDLDFASGTRLLPDETVLLVSFDPQDAEWAPAFRAHHGIADSVRLMGPYRGALDRFGQVMLQRADDRPLDDPAFVPRVIEDEVRYDDFVPWPASTAGLSLTRSSAEAYGNDATSWSSVSPTPGRFAAHGVGDFDGNGQVDAEDIDALCRQIHAAHDPAFDLNADGRLDQTDFDQMIANVLKTSTGDSNLDRRFDSSDLVLVFRAGQYEDGVAENSGWMQGDWNCDREFSSGDLVAAFRAGTFVAAGTALPHDSVAAAVDAIMFGVPSPVVVALQTLDSDGEEDASLTLNKRRPARNDLGEIPPPAAENTLRSFKQNADPADAAGAKLLDLDGKPDRLGTQQLNPVESNGRGLFFERND